MGRRLVGIHLLQRFPNIFFPWRIHTHILIVVHVLKTKMCSSPAYLRIFFLKSREKNKNCSPRSYLLEFFTDDWIAEVIQMCRHTQYQLMCWVYFMDTLTCFRVVENDLFKQDWRSRKKKQIFQYIVLKWSLVLLIGLLTGLVGFFNNLAVENIAGLKLLHTSRLMLKER